MSKERIGQPERLKSDSRTSVKNGEKCRNHLAVSKGECAQQVYREDVSLVKYDVGDSSAFKVQRF